MVFLTFETVTSHSDLSNIFSMFLLTFWPLLLVFSRLKIDMKVHITDRCFLIHDRKLRHILTIK